MSNKSPINFLGALVGAKGARDTSRMKRRLRKVAKKVNIIDNTTRKIARLMPKPGLTDPIDTNANVGITDNTVPNTPASPPGLQPPGQTFPPGTENAAGQMFGQPIDQSFDRDMGMGMEDIDEEIV